MNLRMWLPYQFFTWCDHTVIGSWIKHQTWVFAIIETTHILALTLLVGGILVVDARLLGFGLRRRPVAQVAGALQPYILASLITTFVTGVLMYLSEAVRLSISVPFFYKLVLFVLAIAVHFTIYRKATADGAVQDSRLGTLAAYASLFCWLGVALAGRAIGFLP